MHKKIQFLALIPLPLFSLFTQEPILEGTLLGQKELSMENRYADSFVNGVFKDNILLNLAYLRGAVKSKEDINWDEVTKPFLYGFRLDPNQSFAFHEDVDAKYQATLVKTTNAHFNAQEGFKFSGALFGDGVCHLASLIYWVAKEANLNADAPTSHDFRIIPDIPKEYGVSIYSNPGLKQANARQNLYITNNKNKPISFKFEYKQSLRPDGLKDNKVKVSILELN